HHGSTVRRALSTVRCASRSRASRAAAKIRRRCSRCRTDNGGALSTSALIRALYSSSVMPSARAASVRGLSAVALPAGRRVRVLRRLGALSVMAGLLSGCGHANGHEPGVGIVAVRQSGGWLQVVFPGELDAVGVELACWVAHYGGGEESDVGDQRADHL